MRRSSWGWADVARSGTDPMSLAGLISGRATSQAARAVLSNSERVRKTLEAVAPVRHYTDRMDIFLFAPRQWAVLMTGENR